ncbi:MAG: heme-binding protein [Rhodocyclales bacterium]|nr:heme-binding protein [Rhodocyclales bacterium]MBI5791460.1 heme-binding protein [Rhodocyclales bacterium]
MKQIVLTATLALSAISLPQIAAAQTSVDAAPAARTPVPAARGPALELALEAARVAVDTCKGLEQKIGVSVVDSAGVLKVLLATDGASPRGVQSSTNKAVTALTFKTASSQLGEQAKTDKELADKLAANTNYNARAGGVLLKVNNEVIGAIGVGGARGSEKDEACALAGIEKIQSRL